MGKAERHELIELVVANLVFVVGLLLSVFVNYWIVVFALDVGFQLVLIPLVIGFLLFAGIAALCGYCLWNNWVRPLYWKPPTNLKANPAWVLEQLRSVPGVRSAEAEWGDQRWLFRLEVVDPALAAVTLLPIGWIESTLVPEQVTIETSRAAEFDALFLPRVGRSVLTSHSTLVIRRDDFVRMFGAHPLSP